MEKLSTQQQQQLKKISDERLRIKLVASGHEEEAVVDMEREKLLRRYAEVMVEGPKSAPTPAPVNPAPVAYDPEIERAKLAFEPRQCGAEMEERRRKEQRKDEI